MTSKTDWLPDDLHAYLLRVGVRETELLRRLRDETAAIPQHNMQIAPEQGAFMALLVELIGARRCIELGTFTGYSSLCVAIALPPGGEIVCCDVSSEWTDIARRYWDAAGVSDRVTLRLQPALLTLDELLARGDENSFDFAFVDAVKSEYPAYYDRLLQLLRPGGLMVWDNVFWEGEVIRPEVDDADVRGIRELNEALAGDPRVSISMLPVADGLTLVRKR